MTKIEILNLSHYISRHLRLQGIYTVEMLATLGEQELALVPGLGSKAIEEVKLKLADYLADHPLPDSLPAYIRVLGLNKRIYNALHRARVDTVEQLASMSDEEILAVRNIGVNSLDEIKEKLTTYSQENPLANQGQKLPPKEPHKMEDILAEVYFPKPIERLSLSVRSYNALTRAGVESIEHILLMNDQEILKVENIGRKSLQEIRNALSRYLKKHPLPDKFIALAKKFQSRTGKQLHLPIPKSEDHIEEFTPLFDLESLDRISSLLLDKIPIARLALPCQLHYEALSHDIKSVGELMRQTYSVFQQPELLRDRLTRYLDWILEQDEGAWANEIAERGISIFHEEEIKGGSLDELIADWFAELDDRERKIIYARYSLQGKKKTLEELGEQLGVTRERVRQLQGRAENRLKRAYNWVKIESLMVLFKHLLDETGGIINKRQIRRGIRQMLSTGNLDPAGVANLVFKLDENVQYLSQINAWGDKDLPLNTVQGIQEQFVNLLEEEKTPLPVQEIITKLKNTTWYQNQQEELKDNFLEICLHAHPQIRIQDGTCSLKKRGWQRVACMITALRQIGEPAHYTVITEHANSLLPPRLRRNDRNTHAYMERHADIFVRVGHGVFGLAEWGLEDDGSLANAAYRVLTEAGKPLHHDIITDKVLETWKVRPNSVLAAMEMDNRFVNIGSGVYWLSDQEMVEATVDFGDLFGTQLVQAQKEMDRWEDEGQYDTHEEVDTLRSLGTDIFKE